MGQTHFTTTPNNSGLGNPLATAFEMQESMNTELYETVVFEVPGMQLTEAVFTNADKLKLDSITLPIAPQVQADFNETNPLLLSYINNKPENTSDFTNDGDGVNPFVPDIDTGGIYARVSGGWILLSDFVFPKGVEFTAVGGETEFEIGTTALATMMFYNGVPQSGTMWDQAGTTINLNFDNPLNAGDFMQFT